MEIGHPGNVLLTGSQEVFRRWSMLRDECACALSYLFFAKRSGTARRISHKEINKS